MIPVKEDPLALSSVPSTSQKLTWRPAVDGLRGLAVLAVMLFHFHHASFGSSPPGLFPGGAFGVDLFFVLSGFLITTVLLQELRSTGSVAIWSFYARRALRLLPALAVMMGVFGFVFVVFNNSEFTGQQPASLFPHNLFFVSTYSLNWLGAIGEPRAWGLGHLWSLAVEEQFYVAWPFVLILLSRLCSNPRVLLIVSLLVFVSSASLVFWSNANPDRYYFGTDFRLQELLAGCILAQLYVSGTIRRTIIESLSFRVGLAVSWIYLFVLVMFLQDREAFMLAGGFTSVAVASSCLLVGALFTEQGLSAALLANRVIVYIGTRSYALYLWHYPIGFWLRDLESVPQLILSFGLSFLAAEASFRLVERPALRLKAKVGPRNGSSRIGGISGSQTTTGSVADAA